MANKKWLVSLFIGFALINGLVLNVQAETSSSNISESMTTGNNLDETNDLTPLKLTMSTQSNDAAYYDYEALLSYIDTYDNIDDIVTADILANFEPAVSFDRYTSANVPELFEGEEIWQYVYTATDQMTGESSDLSITLFFNGNLLISAMLTSDNVEENDMLDLDTLEDLTQSSSLANLEDAQPAALLQGVVKYNNQILHHLVVPTDTEQHYLLYLDGELIDNKVVALDENQESIHRIIDSITQVAQNIGLLEEAS
ncbi:hypothetical protein HZY88_07040 [Aerococcaceae bacterium DSM 111176]|nr:hypothetical protein [Aerococcaceae bacterium DSM 111176]